MDRARRNAKIVKLVRARKLTMHEIGGMFDLTRGAVSVIAKAHGVAPGVRRLNPSKVLKAVRLIDRGMPVAHAAQTAGLRADSLANRGLYQPEKGCNRRWTDREVRVLRRDYGKSGHSLRAIGAALGRTRKGVKAKAGRLGLSWPRNVAASPR